MQLSASIILFWLSILVLVYTFAGYPFLVWVLAKVFPRPQVKPVPSACPAYMPTVTVVLVARNEAQLIAGRLHNLLDSDYPADRMRIIVISDGSDDDMLQRVESLNCKNVYSREYPEQCGKTFGINQALQQVPEGVVLFTDARQSFAKETIKLLVTAFADLRVGAVSGELEIGSEDDSVSKGVDMYWRLERFIRKAEARLDSCIGCSGAVYAVRRNLTQNLPEDTILDDVVIPMQIAQKGYRVLFNSAAKARDPQPFSAEKEKKRKRRTICGNFQMLFRYPHWLLPWRNRLWWQLVSHKYLRLASPLLLSIIFLSNLFLLGNAFYALIFLLQCCCYILGIVGILLPKVTGRIFSVPAGFLFLNIQIVQGLLDYISGSYKRGW